MKTFYITSKNDEIKMDFNCNGLSLMFCKICDEPTEKCKATRYLLDNGAKLYSFNMFNNEMRYVFNFPKSISIDSIRNAVYRAKETCRGCNITWFTRCQGK